MATKKPAAKAKPKTTKAARATKATTNTTVKKPVVTIQNNSVNLRRINLVSAVLFVVLAVLAGVLMKASTYETTVTYLTSDHLAGGAIVGAYRHFMDVDVRWLTVGLLALSALVPVLHVTKREAAYANYLKGKVLPWRWAEQGLLQGFMVTIVALLVGFQDVVTLKLFAITTIVVSVLSWYAERQAGADKKRALRTHLFALLAAVAVIIYLGSSLVLTYMYGQVRASWFVYALFGAFSLTLIVNSLKQLKYLHGHSAYKNYDVYERDHLLVSLVSKLVFAVVLIVGLAK